MFDLYWRLVFKPYWARITAIAVSVFVCSTLDVIGIGMIVPVVSLLISPQDSSSMWMVGIVEQGATRFGLDFNNNAVVIVGLLILLVIMVVKNGIMLAQNLLLQRLAASVEVSFRVRMFERFMRATYDNVMSRGRGVTIEDLSRASTGVVSSITVAAGLLNAIAQIITGTILLFYLASWTVLVVAIPLLLVYRVFGPSLQGRSRELGIKLHDIRQRQSVAIVDFLDGIRVIKTGVVEDMASKRIESLMREHLPLYITSRVLPIIPAALYEVVGAILVTVLIICIVIMPELGLTLAELAALVVLIRRLLPTVSSLNQNMINLNHQVRVVQVADNTLNKMPVEDSGGILLDSTKTIDKIEMKNVSFSYIERNNTLVLDNVNLTLRRGQVTALVGQTGSGKSTIADLIIRLYDPNTGSIVVDDTDLRKIDLSAWRKRVGFVGQDPYLFHTTLKNNITLWDPTINDTEIERAMHTAQLTDFLSSLPDGYETLVGDRGLKLSGGQRQRVAIARAILNQPDVLIFDEATSSLDNLTEKEVHDAISKLREGATVLVIAHRLTTVSDANVVVVLDQGNIVEQGHPDDLISSRGEFWRLYQNDSDASEHQIASI